MTPADKAKEEKARRLYASCIRKIGYKSRARAESVIEKMMVDLPAKDVLKLNSYRCGCCKLWHVGNSGGRK